jgi:aminoglycoside phosphotransferase (APT) family kinase protein
MSMDRRNPLQPFDRSLIQRFLRGRDLLSVDLLQSGKSNTNYKLVLSDGNKYVLRLYSHGNAAREAYVMSLVEDLVPVPSEVDRGENWSVFTFLDGELLENAPEHSDKAAEALARISSLDFESPGIVNADGTISAFPFGGVRGFISERLGNTEVRQWIGPRVVDVIFEVMEKEAHRLEELESESHLVHGDFNPTNILIRGGVVIGILDWEYCHSGTPYMDIGNLLRHTLPEHHSKIKAGLEAGGMCLPMDWSERAELVDLTSHLEFLTSNRSASFKKQCAARVFKLMRSYGYGI